MKIIPFFMGLVCPVLACIGCQLPIDPSFIVPPKYPIDSKIAIIGSGQSGIYTARKLIQLGYNDITMFEKDQIGGLTQSVFIDDKWYDFQAHLIASRYYSAYPHPETSAMLIETPWPYFQHEEIKWRNSSGKTLPVCLEKIMKIPPTIFLSNLIHSHLELQNYYWGGFGEGGISSMPPQRDPKLWTLLSPLPNWLPSWMQGSSLSKYIVPILDNVSRLFFSPETFSLVGVPDLRKDWSTGKHDFSELSSCLHETLANSANMMRPEMETAFIIRLNTLLQLIEQALIPSMLENTANDPVKTQKVMDAFLEYLPISLRKGLIHSRNYANYGGWNNWMKSIIRTQQEKADFKVIQKEVTKLEGSDEGVVIVDSDNQIHHFDVAIITSRPADTRKFITDPVMLELFSEKFCPTVWTRSVLVNVSQEDPLPDNGLGFWILEPYATLTGVDDEKARNYYTGCNKQEQGSLWMCFSNSDGPDEITPEAAFDFVRNQMRSLGFGEISHVDERLVNWPVYVRAGSDFYERIKTIQGHNNIFIGGEIMSGPTLELIIDYVSESVPYWFKVVQRG